MSTRRRSIYSLAVIGLIMALMAWLMPGFALAQDGDEAPAAEVAAVAEESSEVQAESAGEMPVGDSAQKAADVAPEKPAELASEVPLSEDPFVGEPVGSARDAENAGDVTVSSDAQAATDMLNTWDVTMRIEAKDARETSDVVLVIDRSQNIQAAKGVANAFVDKLLGDGSSNVRIALVSFAEQATTNVGLTGDAVSLKNAINGLSAGDGAFTQAGIHVARGILSPGTSTAKNKHIVLVSSGVPTYSYAIYNPKNYIPGGNKGETTTEVPESAFNYGSRVGDGSSITTHINGQRYYNHGNSAIAEAGFAKSDGHTVWSVGLQLTQGSQGYNVMQAIASAQGNFKNVANANGLTGDVFEAIRGGVTSAMSVGDVTVPLAEGFELVPTAEGDVTSVPAGQVTYNAGSKSLTWTPGTLTESDQDSSDVKYAELKYRVTINDGILNANQVPNTGGEFYINKSASVSYTNSNNESAAKDFPTLSVNPSIYTVEKKLYDDDKQIFESDKTFTANVTKTETPAYSKEYSLAVETNTDGTPMDGRHVLVGLPSAGTYTITETGDLDDYSVSYQLGNATETDTAVVQITGAGEDLAITIHNRPSNGELFVQLKLAGTAQDEAKTLTYSGEYECVKNGSTRATGTWEISGKDADKPILVATSVPTGSVCTVTQNPLPEGTAEEYKWTDFYSWDPTAGQSAEAEISAKDKKGTATLTNTLDRKLGKVTWTKVDATSSDLVLGGSEWNLTKPDGTELPLVDDNKDGLFEVTELEWGTYTLEETLAPAGYMVDSTSRTFTIGLPSDDPKLHQSLGNIPNAKVTGPSIPLTGGISRDAFNLAGGLFVALGLTVYGIYGLRRRNN